MSLQRPMAPDPYEFLPPRPWFEVTSTDLVDGQPMPMPNVHGSAGGQNISPQLAWSGAPTGHEGLRRHLLRPGRPDWVRILALVGRGHPSVGDGAGPRRRGR